ncbi:MAG: PilZ domain-containing protein [Deltaproteobacteria bacterium]|nr:PilZ domain-containing protein [Deltaproteobacteria bacterium]
MEESIYAKMRDKKRFNVELKATYSIKGQGLQRQACRIANLSSSGATACFPRNESLKSGSVIAMDIAIPNTIMRIAIEAEIMWTRQRFNELISGVKFMCMFSDNMIRQLVKKIP